MALFWIYALGALERVRTKGFRKCTFRHNSALGLIPENDDATAFLSSSSSSLVTTLVLLCVHSLKVSNNRRFLSQNASQGSYERPGGLHHLPKIQD